MNCGPIVGDWHWPPLNMADTMLTIGVVLLTTGSLWPARSIATVRDRSSRGGH